MIITQQKPFEEIIGFLERSNAVFICGCSECATLCKTGGEEEVKQMKKRLEETGGQENSIYVNHTTKRWLLRKKRRPKKLKLRFPQ